MIPDNVGCNIHRMLPAREGREKQRWDGEIRLVAGCVPLYKGKVVLVKSAKKDQYILPKGGWDNDETIKEAASRESYEEAGVKGHITGESLVTVDFEHNKGNKCRMSVFAMIVEEMLEDWPEKSKRNRSLFTAEDAVSLLKRPGMVEAVREAEKRGLLQTSKHFDRRQEADVNQSNKERENESSKDSHIEGCILL
mmetsp:Transcript_18045/g.23752  ORF Transcript_18045/g.23752 Transcript_18045/m.23752 type:complete len:195 (-) Transcript_18045:296-880(-)